MSIGFDPVSDLSDRARFARLTAAPGLAAPVNDLCAWVEALRRLPGLRGPHVTAEARKEAFRAVRTTLLDRLEAGPVDDAATAVVLLTMLGVSNSTGQPFVPEDTARLMQGDLIEALAGRLDALYASASLPPSGPVVFLWVARAAALYPGLRAHLSARVVAYLDELLTAPGSVETARACPPSDRVLAHLRAVRRPARFAAAPVPLRAQERMRLLLGGHYRRWTWKATANLAAVAVIVLTAMAGVALWTSGSSELERFEARYVVPLEDGPR